MPTAEKSKVRVNSSIAQRFQSDRQVAYKQLDQLAGRLGFKKEDGSGIAYGNFVELLTEYVALVTTGEYPVTKVNRSVKASIGKLEQATADQRKVAIKQLLANLSPEERQELLGQ